MYTILIVELSTLRILILIVHSHLDSAWIAGRDNNNEGTWEWYNGLTDTYKQLTYTKWGNNEPDAGETDLLCFILSLYVWRISHTLCT